MNIKKQRKLWAKNAQSLRAKTAGLGNKIVDENLFIEDIKLTVSESGNLIVDRTIIDVTIKEPTRFNRKTQQHYFANNRPNADQVAVTEAGARINVMPLLRMGSLKVR